MKVTYNNLDKGEVGDILILHNRLWYVMQNSQNNLLALRETNFSPSGTTTIHYNDHNIQAIFRNTSIEQIKHNYPEFFI